MKGDALSYSWPPTGAVDELATLLRSRLAVVDEGETEDCLTFHDSFDSRLFQAGLQLDESRAQGRQKLTLRGLNEAPVCEPIHLKGAVPGFHQDYPTGPLRDRLAAALQMRRLLPQVEIRRRETIFKQLDEEHKTVLRIRVREHGARPAGRKGGAYRPMAAQVMLLPVRGYDKPLARARELLGDELGLQPWHGPLVVQALAALDRHPLDYSTRLDIRLDPTMSTHEAALAIQATLLETLQANLAGTRAGLDSEFLHDFRVAVRRARSALGQIRGVFPEAQLALLKRECAWLGQITGPTRDMDVYLLDFDEYRDSLPEACRPDLAPLRTFLLAHQAAERRALVRKLGSPRFRSALKAWQDLLAAPPPSAELAPNAGKPVVKMAGKRIYRVFNQVVEQGQAITAQSPPQALHDLRKRCKKLRYLMEFFQSLYPAERIRPLVRMLKGLLDSLGEYQDLEVQAEKLREFAHQMVNEGEVPADTLLAMGMLVDGLLKRQQQSRLAFAGRFARFAGPAQRTVYEALFCPRRRHERSKRERG
jgi:CHAD domain-containing protein